jgi:hypothetical protein
LSQTLLGDTFLEPLFAHPLSELQEDLFVHTYTRSVGRRYL